MSVCTPSPNQVLSPCANDAVGSLQALGTRGDVAFFEQGSLILTAGQTEVIIAFNFEKTSAEYVFNHCYVKSPTADSIIAVVKTQTVTGFTVELTGAVVAANDVLVWEVQIPDPLQVCQSASGGPQYAIVPPYQQGVEVIPNGASFLVVTFPLAQPTSSYALTLTIENLVGGDFVFAWSVVARSTTGFRVNLSGMTNTGDYRLRWKAQ